MADLDTCIVCGLSDTAKLSNTMSILLDDGTKATIKICDEHAPDLTMKKAKELYAQKNNVLAQAMELLRNAGYQISSGNNLLVPIKVETPPQPVAAMPIAEISQPLVSQPVVIQPLADPPPNSFKVTDLNKLDRLSSQSTVNAGGDATSKVGAGSAPIAIKLQNMTDADKHVVESIERHRSSGEAIIAPVETVGGKMINVPVYRRDGTGTTILNIRKTTKETFARNFKDMAQRSQAGHMPDQGYGGPCGFCRGEGAITNNGQLASCPKCNGSGMKNQS